MNFSKNQAKRIVTFVAGLVREGRQNRSVCAQV
jgi:FtsZ-interacting cell division protein YlmF